MDVNNLVENNHKKERETTRNNLAEYQKLQTELLARKVVLYDEIDLVYKNLNKIRKSITSAQKRLGEYVPVKERIFKFVSEQGEKGTTLVEIKQFLEDNNLGDAKANTSVVYQMLGSGYLKRNKNIMFCGSPPQRLNSGELRSKTLAVMVEDVWYTHKEVIDKLPKTGAVNLTILVQTGYLKEDRSSTPIRYSLAKPQEPLCQ